MLTRSLSLSRHFRALSSYPTSHLLRLNSSVNYFRLFSLASEQSTTALSTTPVATGPVSNAHEEAKEAREIKKLQLEEDKGKRDADRFVFEVNKEARDIERLALEKRTNYIGRSGVLGLTIAGLWFAWSWLEEHKKQNRANIGLLYAIQSGDEAESLRLIEDSGLQIDLDFQDPQQQYTALHHAAQKGYAHIVSALLARGARVDLQDKNGETPFYKAIFCGQVEVVDQLILASTHQKIAEMINLPNSQGNTPIMAAVYSDNYQLLEKVLNLGANIEHINEKGQTILHFAMEYERYNIARKLILGVIDKEKYRSVCQPTCSVLVLNNLAEWALSEGNLQEAKTSEGLLAISETPSFTASFSEKYTSPVLNKKTTENMVQFRRSRL